MIPIPKAAPAPKVKRVSIRDFLKGTVHAQDDGRTPQNGLRDSSNMIIEQDGVLRPRPSLRQYGPQPTGTVLGEVYEFSRENSGVREYWLITIQNVGGTAKVYVAKGEDSSWTICNGKTYNTTADAHFLQIADKILIMNGEDNLSYLDTSDMSVTAYTELDDPNAPTLDTNTGLSGTDFNVYYAVTSNSTVGETAGSDELTVQVSTDRDIWDPDTQSITIARTQVTDEESWNVYMGISADGAGTPKMYAIATGLDPSITTFTDNGTRAQDLTKPLPTSNSTAGPKATRGCVFQGRAFLVGIKDSRYDVIRGGDYGFELDFSPANGGGTTPVGNGTKDVPVKAVPFRTGKGDAKLMIIQQGTNGSGRRSFMEPTTVTYGSQTFIVWQVTEDSGQDGTDSPDGVIVYDNSVWYPSRDGFKTTGTKPSLQNILSVDKITNSIRTDIPTLNTDAMAGCVGLAYDNRLYWAVPVLSSSNNQIWVFDLERKGAWMTQWNIDADWMTLYNDNEGKTHHLILHNNTISELTYMVKTADNGTGFRTQGLSGQVRFSEDGREWGRLIQLIFVVLRAQGDVNFNVTGQGEDPELISVTEAQSFSGNSTRAGWGEAQAGWSSRGWSTIKAVPSTFNTASQDVIIEVDEDLQWFQYAWNSTDSGVDYQISEIIAEYVPVGIKDLT